jgi:hypothetical protein
MVHPLGDLGREKADSAEIEDRVLVHFHSPFFGLFDVAIKGERSEPASIVT